MSSNASLYKGLVYEEPYHADASAPQKKKSRYVLIAIIAIAALLVAVIVTVVLVIVLTAKSKTNSQANPEVLSHWTAASARQQIIDYVNDVTNPKSSNYIPPEDRIVVSDLDGTLFCETMPTNFPHILYHYRVREDPEFAPTDEMLEYDDNITTYIRTGKKPEGYLQNGLTLHGRIFENMTQNEYIEYVKKIAQAPSKQFFGLTYGNAFFVPMSELVNYLTDNQFMVYIISGSERDQVRAVVDRHLPIPPERIIGTDYDFIIAGVNDLTAYQYTTDTTLVRGATPISVISKTTKITAIQREIHKHPVIALGNSGGDISMLTYVTANQKYRSFGLMVIPDDNERAYSIDSSAAQLTALCKERGWIAASMKNDFGTIFGDSIIRNPVDTKPQPWPN